MAASYSDNACSLHQRGNIFATVRFAASAGVVVHLRDKLDIGLAVVQAGGRLGLGDGGGEQRGKRGGKQ